LGVEHVRVIVVIGRNGKQARDDDIELIGCLENGLDSRSTRNEIDFDGKKILLKQYLIIIAIEKVAFDLNICGVIAEIHDETDRQEYHEGDGDKVEKPMLHEDFSIGIKC
jgi:hypothetical protein